MKVTLLLINLLLLRYCVAQSAFDSLLQQIERNNYDIKAQQERMDWKGSAFNTNRFLSDPQVEYDYLFSNPAAAGDQKELAITQQFDFPFVYKKKKDLFNEQRLQLQTEHKLFRQETLLQAKLLLLQQVWLNKRQAAIERRLEQTAQLVGLYERKMEQGEVTILDLNKSRLKLYQIRKDSAFNKYRVESNYLKLVEMNGGLDFVFTDTIYPQQPFLPGFEVLDSLIELQDLEPQIFEHELKVLQHQLDVVKASGLPKMEIGYHSQSILSQQYRGIHLGFTIPITENRNKVRAARSNLRYETFLHDKHRIEHKLKNKDLYHLISVHRQTMQEYQKLMAGMRTKELLEKTLRLGEMTVNNFFEETDLLFSVYDEFLKVEIDYHQALARMFRFRL